MDVTEGNNESGVALWEIRIRTRTPLPVCDSENVGRLADRLRRFKSYLIKYLPTRRQLSPAVCARLVTRTLGHPGDVPAADQSWMLRGHNLPPIRNSRGTQDGSRFSANARVPSVISSLYSSASKVIRSTRP
jgi:hypothetical protein